MGIQHFSYLVCDICHNVCGGSESVSGRYARNYGKVRGWKRLDGKDICPKCAKEAGLDDET